MRLCSVVLMWFILGAGILHAEWPTDLGSGLPVAVGPPVQQNPESTSDGEGGILVTWEVWGNGSFDIYAQRLNPDGVPLWLPDGVPVCTDPSPQFSPRIVSDGRGGAIVSWRDRRNGVNDVFAQRIDAIGRTVWAADGVWASNDVGDKTLDDMATADGRSVVLVWTYRQGGLSGNEDLYAQKLDDQGTPLWGAGGVAVCKEPGRQLDARLVANDSVLIVTWEDSRFGNPDIFMRRLRPDGTGLGPDSGTAVCVQPARQGQPMVVSDGQGGAFILWQDSRAELGSGLSSGHGLEGIFVDDIYARRVDKEGFLSGGPTGLPVADAPEAQYNATVIADGRGGAIVAWIDTRSSTAGQMIYAQRINKFIQRLWTSSGVLLTEAPSNASDLVMVSDGDGGAIVLWEDGRGFQRDIYGRRVTWEGQKRWDDGGRAVAAGQGYHVNIRPVPDGRGGAIVAYQYSQGFGDGDIYAKRIDGYGALGDASPRIVAVRDVPGDQGGQVSVLWNPSSLDGEEDRGVYIYRLYRGMPASALQLSAGNVDEESVVTSSERSGGAYLGSTYAAAAGDSLYWEFIGESYPEGLPGYALTVETPTDSGPGGPGVYSYMVRAEGTWSAVWASNIASGYSLDNLAPEAPQNLSATVASARVILRWKKNLEDDLLEYRIYRSAEPGVDPTALQALGSSLDTLFVDEAPMSGNAFYVVAAVDVHGNQSVGSNEVALIVQDAELEPSVPVVFALEQNYPNPFNPSTTIRYALPEGRRVLLEVFDAAGQKVRTLVDAQRHAGYHEEVWDARNESGAAVASGLYIYRLVAGNFSRTRTMLLLR